ncbi:MAG: ribosome biogenesis GTPase Der [Sedimentisphaerales bacterium]|nr:ribosome biogenesis GTPase Der [Sedimentisphaerales bacterium]
MALPVVAIIGRPNVGKSSLLNALAGQMISIVEPTPGVTRDRVSALVGRDNRYFELVDTGGYGIVDADRLSGHIEQQIIQAIASAQLILFMVDIRDGVVPLDVTIAQLLRKHKLNVIGVANKADNARMFPAAGEFAKLGFGEFLCISVLENINKSVLLDRIYEELSHLEPGSPAEPVMKIAIVGKRNVGKSTLVNAMAGFERVIVSEIPGTTRDSVDVRIEKDGKTIIVIDTAGVRKKSSMADSIEFYSSVRAERSIRRADVVLFLIDATEPISQVDKTLARLIVSEYKSCIIVVNKWDLAKDSAVTSDYEDYLWKLMPALRYSPIAFTTATEAKNIQSVLDLAGEIFKQTTTWIPTPKLNAAFEQIKTDQPGTTKRRGAGPKGTGRPKIYYATQVAVNPITILMFVNKPDLFDEKYLRFIVNRLQSMLPIEEVPIKLLARAHRKQ